MFTQRLVLGIAVDALFGVANRAMNKMDLSAPLSIIYGQYPRQPKRFNHA